MTSAYAKVFSTVSEALERVFPGARIERLTVYLTDEQVEEARSLSGEDIPYAIVYPYEAYDEDDEYMGTAYFDAHLVRTLPETLMIVVSPDQTVLHVEAIVFREPEGYMPSVRWYAQFEDQALDDDLRLKREIDGITGATLSSRATTEAVRRTLAVHKILTNRISP